MTAKIGRLIGGERSELKFIRQLVMPDGISLCLKPTRILLGKNA